MVIMSCECTEQELEINKFADKLAVLYELFNWTWRDNKNPPTANEIKENIYHLIKEAKKYADGDGNGWGSISGGGLSVQIDEDSLDITWSKEEALYLQFTNELIQ